MNADVLFPVYIFLLALSLMLGIYRFNRADYAVRIVIALLALTAISEITAEIFAIKYRNNMRIYHIFNPIELFLISLYFNTTIQAFKKKNIGIIIGGMGILVSILNTIFLQPFDTLNSNFLLFEGFCIIMMSLFSYQHFFDDVETAVLDNPHFWLSSIFLFSSGITYTNWALYTIITLQHAEYSPFINTALIVVNTVIYTGIGLIFLFLPKKLEKT